MYNGYDKDLEVTLARVNGNSQQIGTIPSRCGEKVILRKEMENLKTRLQEAVSREEYEKAAEIRDNLKNMESRLV